jgi:hypothetical protein
VEGKAGRNHQSSFLESLFQSLRFFPLHLVTIPVAYELTLLASERTPATESGEREHRLLKLAYSRFDGEDGKMTISEGISIGKTRSFHPHAGRSSVRCGLDVCKADLTVMNLSGSFSAGWRGDW